MTKISTEYITLQQFLKLADLASSGGEAKSIIQSGKVFVNGQVETRRGKKLYPGDTVRTGSRSEKVENEN